MTMRKFSHRLFLSATTGVIMAIMSGCSGLHPEPADADPTPVAVINGLKVRYDFIADNAYNRRHKMPGPFTDVNTVTIHNTAEPLSAREERDRVDYRRDQMSVSFHFAVDENEAVQLLPLNRHAWHAGDGEKGPGNTASIGIEICRSQCYGRDGELYRRAEANAVLLAAWLLDTYDLPSDALKKHEDWTGKHCPHRILDEQRWESFKARVAAAMKSRRPRETGYDDAHLGMAVVLGEYQGKNVCQTTAGDIYPTVEALIDGLKKQHITVIDVSSWIDHMPPEEQRRQYLDLLRKAGFEVRRFYVYHPGSTVYDREDLVQSDGAPGSYEHYLSQRPAVKEKSCQSIH